MTSFISALSIFILVLASGCFTLPITENPLSETSSPFYNDVTTDKLFGERMALETSSIFDDATREPRMLEDVTEESSTSEDATREPRTFEDATEESSTFEDATREPRMLFDSNTDVSSTAEESSSQQGEMKDSSVVTVEPTTERAEFVPRDLETDSQNETEWTTESSHSKREFEDSAFTTDAGERSSEQRLTTVEPEMSSVDLTTDIMSSFTSTLSAVAPEVYTRDSSTTRKYVGLLADKENQEEEAEHTDEENKKSSGKDQQELEEPEKPRKKTQPKKVQRKNQQELEEQKGEDENKDEQPEKPQPKKLKGKPQQELEEHKDEDDEIEKPRRKPQPKKLKGQKQQELEEHKDEELEKPQPELEELEKPRRKPAPKKPVHESEELKDEEPRPKHHPKKPVHESEELEKPRPKHHPKKPHGKHEHDSSEELKKESGEEKKFSGKHQKEEERQPEKHEEDNLDVVRPKYVIKKRPTTVRKLKIESDDGIQYPQAVYDQDAWKNLGKIPSDFAVLDETNDVVTALNKLDSLNTEESKLNQGKESSRAE